MISCRSHRITVSPFFYRTGIDVADSASINLFVSSLSVCVFSKYYYLLECNMSLFIMSWNYSRNKQERMHSVRLFLMCSIIMSVLYVLLKSALHISRTIAPVPLSTQPSSLSSKLDFLYTLIPNIHCVYWHIFSILVNSRKNSGFNRTNDVEVIWV